MLKDVVPSWRCLGRWELWHVGPRWRKLGPLGYISGGYIKTSVSQFWFLRFHEGGKKLCSMCSLPWCLDTHPEPRAEGPWTETYDPVSKNNLSKLFISGVSSQLQRMNMNSQLFFTRNECNQDSSTWYTPYPHTLCTQCLGLQSRKATQVPGTQQMIAAIAIILLLTRMMLESDFSSPTPFFLT